MGSYRLSEEAEADLYRIWLYGLEWWGPERADQYISEFFIRFNELAENPLQYPELNDIRHGYRCSVSGTDSIYYRVENATVEVMAIIGKQDTQQWL
jgi:toxin ParE1/3/4